MSIGREHGTSNAVPVISTKTMTAPQLAELIGAGRCPAFRPRYADDEPRGRMAHAGD